MSKLTALLDELCPDGVEYVTAGEIAQIGTGSSDRKDAIEGGEFPFFVRSETVMRHSEYEHDETAIVIPGEGGVGEIFHYVSGKYALHQRAYRISFTTDDIDTRFAFYHFQANFKRFIERVAVTATVKSIRKPMLTKFPIPVPPLEVQQEIVRVLDAFTDLEQSLVSELELRKKQFASVLDEQIYSATLLDPRGRVGKLGEVAHYVTDRVDSEKLENSQFVGVDNLLPNLSGVRSSTYGPNTKRVAAFEAGDILLGNIRPYLRKMWLSDRSGGCSGDVLPIRINESHSDLVDPKYLYFALTSDRFFDFNMQHARGGKMPRGNKSMILEYSFPIPTLETQLKVSNRLNVLESLIQSIEQEISLRRKQYEFYRDELLSFAPKED